jgi:metal-responsive CopG/Arc/MetJ family transcriptional regulator
MAKKAQHGGAREGAGRPPKAEGKTMVVAVSVPEGLAKDLAGYAEAQGQSKSAVVTEALKGFLARKKR